MRLVPLNKVSPNIPNIDKFRPIMIMSHLVNVIEMRFMDNFKKIVEEVISPI